MSSEAAEENTDDWGVCANCGIAGVDEIKLKKCTGCDGLVKYCSVGCQKNHRPRHKRACKKRAAEIRDDRLFRQPDSSHFGECPICFLPLPLSRAKSIFMTCCSKRICKGCIYANYLSNDHDMVKARTCPLCREPHLTDAENGKRNMKRIEANDPAAFCYAGTQCIVNDDYDGAFEYWTKAAELGDIEAHYKLGLLYHDEEGIYKDEGKAVYYYEKAAIGGNPDARYNLGCIEEENGNIERGREALDHRSQPWMW